MKIGAPWAQFGFAAILGFVITLAIASGCRFLPGKPPGITCLSADTRAGGGGLTAAKAYLDRKVYKYECQEGSLFAMFDCRSGSNILACQFSEGDQGTIIVRAGFRVEGFSPRTVKRLLKPAGKLEWERCKEIIGISVQCTDGQLDRALSDILESWEMLMRRAHRRTQKEEKPSNTMRQVAMGAALRQTA